MVLRFLFLLVCSVLSFETLACKLTYNLSQSCAEELEQTLFKPLKIFRSANLLHLPTQPEALVFPVVPSKQTEEYAEPYIVGHFKKTDMALVWVYEHVGRSVYLVHLPSGHQTQINGFPIFSPDNQRLVVYSESVTEDFTAKLLTIYRLNRQGRLHIEHILDGNDNRLLSWTPDDLEWHSATQISFNNAPARARKKGEPQHFLELTEKRWRLVPADLVNLDFHSSEHEKAGN